MFRIARVSSQTPDDTTLPQGKHSSSGMLRRSYTFLCCRHLKQSINPQITWASDTKGATPAAKCCLLAAHHASSLHAGTGEEITCQCCFCEVLPPEATAMRCGHAFCNDCWTRHFQIQIGDGNCRLIACMAPGCGAVCDDDQVSACQLCPVVHHCVTEQSCICPHCPERC